MRISTLRPTLDAHGVKLVAVGLEQLGAEEFVEQRFFDGRKQMHTCKHGSYSFQKCCPSNRLLSTYPAFHALFMIHAVLIQ